VCAVKFARESEVLYLPETADTERPFVGVAVVAIEKTVAGAEPLPDLLIGASHSLGFCGLQSVPGEAEKG
jgi:hypothetical protein